MRIRFEGPSGSDPKIDRALVWAVRELQQRTVDRAREVAAVKTGTFRRSITAEEPEVQPGRIVGAVGAGGAGAPYAKAHEYGTGVYSEADDSKRQPIVILPVRRKALAWPAPAMGAPGGPFRRLSGSLRTPVLRRLQQGKLKPSQVYVFARRVVQQGQRPHPTLRRAFEESMNYVDQVVQEALRKVWG